MRKNLNFGCIINRASLEQGRIILIILNEEGLQ
jgi:hypothetical protein